MTPATWQGFTDDLTQRLPALQTHDVTIIDAGPWFLQWQQLPQSLALNVSGNPILPTTAHLSETQHQQLAALGWNPPRPPDYDNWHRHHPWPMSTTEARATAELIVTTLREILGATQVQDLRIQTFNAANR